MLDKVERTRIGEGIYLTEIVDRKFKTNYIKVQFSVPADEDKGGVNALLAMLLLTSNSEIPSRSALSRKLIGLYGSAVAVRFGNIGDNQQLSFSINILMDKYALDSDKNSGESISEQAMKIFLDCIFSPDIKDGHFNEKYFRLRKQELLDNIAASINDKRSYAYIRAKETIFNGEPIAAKEIGTPERAQRITHSELIEQYQYLMKSAQVEIFVSGGGEIDAALQMLKKAFGSIKRENVENISFTSFSPIKSQPAEVFEEMELKQSKMFMAYKSSCEDIYTCKLFAAMLGGTEFSKLFANVREKMSLCYYCDCIYNNHKGTVLIDSGVENKNVEKARAAIEEQVRAMAEGQFTDEELENSKLYLCGGFKSNYDAEDYIAGWYTAQRTRGTCYSPEEVNAIITGITREQVIECAKSFVLDTVYVLKAREEDNEREVGNNG